MNKKGFFKYFLCFVVAFAIGFVSVIIFNGNNSSYADSSTSVENIVVSLADYDEMTYQMPSYSSWDKVTITGVTSIEDNNGITYYNGTVTFTKSQFFNFTADNYAYLYGRGNYTYKRFWVDGTYSTNLYVQNNDDASLNISFNFTNTPITNYTVTIKSQSNDSVIYSASVPSGTKLNNVLPQSQRPVDSTGKTKFVGLTNGRYTYYIISDSVLVNSNVTVYVYMGVNTDYYYNQGVEYGLSQGYDQGFDKGTNYNFLTLFGAIVDAPITALTGLLNFNLLGFNLLSLFYSLFTLLIFVWLLKLLFNSRG